MKFLPEEIAVLGPRGTNTERAVEALGNLRRGAKLKYLYPIAEVFEYVSAHPKAVGVVPVEDSMEGDVPFVLDLLRRHDNLYVIGEIRLPVVHHLLAKSEDLGRIKIIASHHQALSHCRNYLKENFPNAELRETPSTGAAAELATSDPSVAAIAGMEAARIYGLKVVRENIHDQGTNYTRFFVLSQRRICVGKARKTSIMIELPEDRPGILHEILGEFARRSINLTRIESRPDRGVLGEYVFFIDLEGRLSDPKVKAALHAVEEKRAYVRVFGSYGVREIPRKAVVKETSSQLTRDELRLVELALLNYG